jgi:hypothetical protein
MPCAKIVGLVMLLTSCLFSQGFHLTLHVRGKGSLNLSFEAGDDHLKLAQAFVEEHDLHTVGKICLQDKACVANILWNMMKEDMAAKPAPALPASKKEETASVSVAAVFIHVTLMGGALQSLKEILVRLYESGVVDYARTIQINAVGAGTIHSSIWEPILQDQSKKVRISYLGPLDRSVRPLAQNQLSTLQLVHSHALQLSEKALSANAVLFLHTDDFELVQLSADSASTNSNNAVRKTLLAGLVDDHQACIELLQSRKTVGFGLATSDFTNVAPVAKSHTGSASFGYYRANWWWARADHLRNLPALADHWMDMNRGVTDLITDLHRGWLLSSDCCLGREALLALFHEKSSLEHFRECEGGLQGGSGGGGGGGCGTSSGSGSSSSGSGGGTSSGSSSSSSGSGASSGSGRVRWCKRVMVVSQQHFHGEYRLLPPVAGALILAGVPLSTDGSNGHFEAVDPQYHSYALPVYRKKTLAAGKQQVALYLYAHQTESGGGSGGGDSGGSSGSGDSGRSGGGPSAAFRSNATVYDRPVVWTLGTKDHAYDGSGRGYTQTSAPVSGHALGLAERAGKWCAARA